MWRPTNLSKEQYYQAVVDTVPCPTCDVKIGTNCDGFSIAHPDRRTAYDILEKYFATIKSEDWPGLSEYI